MQSNTTRARRLWNLGLAVVAMLAFGPGLAAADYVVGSGEPIVISDDVFDRTTSVISLTGGPSAGGPSSDNKSGLGDGTNPNQGGGTSNAKNTGSDNPNKAKK